MTAAIFALIGVVVGGVLGFVFDILRERRAEQAEFRTAARLVRKEMSAMTLLVTNALREEQGFGKGAVLVQDWAKYEGVLAARMSRQADWDVVSGALSAMTMLNTGYRSHETLDDNEKKVMKSFEFALNRAVPLLEEQSERAPLFERLPGMGRRSRT